MGLDVNDVKRYVMQCPHLDQDPNTEYSTDFSNEKPVSYGLHDNGKSVIETNIIGGRTYRHAYTLIAVYDTVSESRRQNNNRINHAFQDWIMEQNDNKLYPPITDGNIIQMVSSQAVFMGFDGSTSYGRYSTVFFIDYKEVK